MTFNFIKNSSKNRVFCDYVIRLLAVEIVLGSFLTGREECPSYRKYDSEVKTGKHGGYNFVLLHEKVTPKELHELNRLIYIAKNEVFNTANDVADFMQKHLDITDGCTHVIGDLFYCLKKRNFHRGNS